MIWSISALAFTLSDVGTSQMLLREGSRNPGLAKMLAARVLRLQIFLSGLIAAAVCIALLFLPGMPNLSQSERVLVIVTNVLAIGVDRFQNLFTVFGQLAGNYSVYALTRTAYFLSLLVAFCFLFKGGMSLWECSIAYLLITMSAGTLMGVLSWRCLSCLARTDIESMPSWWETLKSGSPFFGISALSLVYGRVEVAGLGVWGHPDQAGVFHFDYQVLLLVYSLSGMFFTVIFPRLYRQHSDLVRLEADYLESCRWLVLLAWLVTPPLVMYAPELLAIVGNPYTVSQAEVLQALAAMLLLLPGAAALNFLMATDRLKQRLVCESVGIGVSIIGALYAALHGSALYAAYSATLGYAVTVFLATRLIHKRVGFYPLILTKEMLRLAVAALPALAMTWALSVNWWQGSLLYFALLVILMVISQHPLVARIKMWWPTSTFSKSSR
jgi:O-antigen/teichoic acid export membrane protein